MFSSSAVQRPLSLLVRVHYGKDVGLKIEILVGSKVSVQLRRQSKNNFDNLIRKKKMIVTVNYMLLAKYFLASLIQKL